MQTLKKPPPHAEALLIAALVVIAILARWVGFHEKTGDMRIFFAWHRQLREAGGWRGIGTEVGNYNAPFLYLLAFTIYLPGPLLLKIKMMWVVFDVVLAFFAYRIVALRRPGSRIPMAAALIVVLLPTVVLNASFWGQIDAMWAAPALGAVYFLLKDKPWWGVALCGVAVAMKPQGIFILPLLLLLVLAGKIPWRTLLAAPAAYLALDVPAVLLGRNPIELLTIYSMDRQARNVPELSLRAPNVFALMPGGPREDTLRTLGYLFAAAVVIGVVYVLIARQVELTRERVVLAAALFSILVPFLLPGMHERYFFLADVLTVVLVMFMPRLWSVPLLVQAASLLSYQPYLFGRVVAVLPTVAALLMLAALIVVSYQLLSPAFKKDPLEEEFELLTINQPSERPVPLPARRA
ncbi:glycosyltransferase 87 family protein [Actinoplanes sp. TRM 88003]|uniref:Glycosyltransferase 87 family protein n=1 Tax=Paractinoplanes aksuensis TaxID=2939490 RepID=A0ABT1DJL1_9ACTN|nr:glycosyltransferase 87 family protein [Actinoplanes aksuensis]MCO8270989.1 glycosyltransferase 87 family protein [Actinoplanes aksuensis]